MQVWTFSWDCLEHEYNENKIADISVSKFCDIRWFSTNTFRFLFISWRESFEFLSTTGNTACLWWEQINVRCKWKIIGVHISCIEKTYSSKSFCPERKAVLSISSVTKWSIRYQCTLCKSVEQLWKCVCGPPRNDRITIYICFDAIVLCLRFRPRFEVCDRKRVVRCATTCLEPKASFD